MKLGSRITITTTALVVTVLVLYGFVSARIRRAELRADLERETQAVGNVLQVSLEAALREGLFEDVRKLVARIQEAEHPMVITYVELVEVPSVEPVGAGSGGGTPDNGGAAGSASAVGAAPAATAAAAAPSAAPPAGGHADASAAGAAPSVAVPEVDDETAYAPPAPDAARDDRIRRIQISGAAYGQHVRRQGSTAYAWTVPLRDDQGRVVAAIDLLRDETDAESALAAMQQNVVLTVLVLGLGLGLMVWLTTRRGISNPLERLVEGIDEVSHGDLTRVILRERDDEIGDLAERFNEMTASLREARDETERGVEARLALEARLRHTEKLATIGQLAASIAHEVGTPLGVIGGRARTLEKKSADPQEVQKNASIIAAQAARITKIIQRVLDYARKKVSARTRVDLAAVVKDSVDFLEHQLAASGVSVRMRPFVADVREAAEAARAEAPSSTRPAAAPLTPHVVGNADELQQVTLNLVLNAMQAMPSGGAIEVALRGTLRRKPGLDLAPPGRYVVLEVADQGGGIDPEDRQRIFEPFYSTKQEGGGTGLGLAVSLGIVKDHDGWIEIDGGAGGGSVFRVFLPAPDESDEDLEPAGHTAGTPAAHDDARSATE